MVTAFVLHDDIFEVFQSFQEIYDKSNFNLLSEAKQEISKNIPILLEKDEDVLKSMEAAEGRNERMVKLFLNISVIRFQILMIIICSVNIVYSLLSYGYINIDQLYKPYKFM